MPASPHTQDSLAPLFMWAGGKTRLIARYAPLWPSHEGPYVEPFLGGGAVFGWLAKQNPGLDAVLGDVNAEIISLMAAVRDDDAAFTAKVQRRAREYLKIETKDSRKAWYYRQRKLYWTRPTPDRLYLLMRLGFNGIWQTCQESNGLYGTPAGLLNQSRLEQIINAEQVKAWSVALRSALLHSGSYTSIPLPDRPALVYLDPPYRDSFTTYGTGFDDKDQAALAGWYRTTVEAGHVVILANRCVPGDTFFEDLIGDIADFHYFDVTYTAGRRARTDDGFKAKPAQEFIAVSR